MCPLKSFCQPSVCFNVGQNPYKCINVSNNICSKICGVFSSYSCILTFLVVLLHCLFRCLCLWFAFVLVFLSFGPALICPSSYVKNFTYFLTYKQKADPPFQKLDSKVQPTFWHQPALLSFVLFFVFFVCFNKY